MNGLQVLSKERKETEVFVLAQVRQQRITGSKCGLILGVRTKALLVSVLYSKPLCPLPVPIKWKKENEANACQAYVDYVHEERWPSHLRNVVSLFIQRKDGLVQLLMESS